MDERPTLRIGELSRRVGLSEHVLRAWETRYGLLHPTRTAGGYRLYSEQDAERIRQVQQRIAAGLSAAEAAGAVLAEAPAAEPSGATVQELADGLRSTLDAFDEPGAQAVLDRLLSDLTVATVLRDVVLPYLHELGERWAAGTASVAQEHFASFVLRGRLSGLARGWGDGRGPRALLACPPYELHDLALMAFGIVLHRQGWRIDFLGTSTPMAELVRAAGSTAPDLVVVAASTPEALQPVEEELVALATRFPLALAGAGASAELSARVGARHLAGDPVSEAELLGA